MPLTTDLKKAESDLSAVFSEKIRVEPTIYKGKPALLVTRAAMYSTPEYTGGGGLYGMMTSMMAACGGNHLDEVGEIRQGGCETCDFGSLYGVKYVVWDE